MYTIANRLGRIGQRTVPPCTSRASLVRGSSISTHSESNLASISVMLNTSSIGVIFYGDYRTELPNPGSCSRRGVCDGGRSCHRVGQRSRQRTQAGMPVLQRLGANCSGVGKVLVTNKLKHIPQKAPPEKAAAGYQPAPRLRKLEADRLYFSQCFHVSG